jgi:hypothetical protein
MAKIDWDWFAELAICETKIIELEVRVASQKQNIELILNRGMDAALAQRVPPLSVRLKSSGVIGISCVSREAV